jgi:hypothetical protein
MPSQKVLEDLVSIVLLGRFNPAIFQPAWLAAKGLIRDGEASGAKVEVIHPEIAQFRADWLHISVTTDRFVASTSDAAQRAPLRDLVLGVFELLDQTPTTRMGLNRTMHVDLGGEDRWHALGHLLAPKAPWAGILEKPGMRTVLLEGIRSDGRPGRTFFRVEPSQKYVHSAFMDVNCEYHLDPKSPGEGTSYFVACLRADWERVMQQAREGIDKLLAQVRVKENG